MKHLPDHDLVLATVSGDKHAFGTLADRHSERARRAAMRMVGNYDIACELVQEAMLQAYLGLNTLREPAYFGAWLVGIVQNVCRTHLRSQRRLTMASDWLDEAERVADETIDPVAQLEAQERRDLVQAAIGALSPKNQAATWLYYIEAMSVDEVARTLNVSANAVKGRLYQARKQLQSELAPFFAPAFGAPQLRPVTTSTFQQRRKRTMATITTVKVHRISPTSNCILYLLDTINNRYLSIWIGAHEGEQIQLQLEGKVTKRPMTFRYFADFLQAMQIELEAVTVARLHESTFYAVTQFRNGELVKELDARPSDAIGLALHAGSPIYVEDELMHENGKPLPTEVDMEQWFAAELERIQEEQLVIENWQAELFETDDAPFTYPARQALQKAVALAQFLGHNYIGTEHLLWGLTKDSDGLAAQLLHKTGITTVVLNQAAIARFGPPQQVVPGTKGAALPPPQIVPRVSTVLELASAAREECNAPYIGTEHLLLGILREGGGMAVTLLQDLEVDLKELERQLLAAIGGVDR